LSNEVKVAILVIVAGILLYFGFNFIKGSNVLSGDNTYYAVYDNVNGLLPGNQIMLNGLKIGLVGSCVFTQDGKNQVIVSMDVDDNVKIPKAAQAKIVAADLLGEMMINIDMSDVTAANANDILQDEDNINGTLVLGMMESMTEEIIPVKDKMEVLMGSADSMINKINGILESGQIEGVLTSADKTIASFEQTSALLNKLINAQSSNINSLMNNLNTLTNTFAANTKQLDGILKNAETFTGDLTEFSAGLKKTELNAIADELSKTLESTNNTMKSLNSTIAEVNSGDGTLGLLLKDPKLYNNLEQTSKSLDNLLTDLKSNPKKYVQFSLIERKRKNKDKDKDKNEENNKDGK